MNKYLVYVPWITRLLTALNRCVSLYNVDQFNFKTPSPHEDSHFASSPANMTVEDQPCPVIWTVIGMGSKKFGQVLWGPLLPSSFNNNFMFLVKCMPLRIQVILHPSESGLI